MSWTEIVQEPGVKWIKMDCLYGGRTIGKDPFKLLFNSQLLRDKIVKPKNCKYHCQIWKQNVQQKHPYNILSLIKAVAIFTIPAVPREQPRKSKFREEISSKLKFA